MLYESLFRIMTDKSTNEIYYAPELAESWQISADSLSYTLNLRKGVKWHNGEPFTADDVKYTLDVSSDNALTMSYTRGITGSDVVNENTIVIHVSEVSPNLIYNLARLAIINKKHHEAKGDAMADEPMGTGPYTLAEHKVEQSLTFVAFEDHWRGAPRIKKITYMIIPDADTQVLSFEAGDFDYYDNVPTSAIEEIRQFGKWTIYDPEIYTPLFIMLNQEVPPYDNKLVRQALHYATNKQANVVFARNGYGVPANGFWHPSLIVGSTNPDKIYTHDLAKAKQLLAEAGYPDGQGFPPIIIQSTAALPVISLSSETLQQDWGELGITVEIETLEVNAYVTNVTLGNFDVGVMFSSVSQLVHPWEVLFAPQYFDAANFSRYNNPVVTDLFDQLARIPGLEEQKAVIKKIINIINEDVVYIPLSFGTRFYAMDPTLTFDVHINDLRIYDLYWTS